MSIDDVAARAAAARARLSAMTPEQKERAFDNLMEFLDDAEWDEVMSKSDAEIRAELEADGVDVDAFVAQARVRIDEMLAKRREALAKSEPLPSDDEPDLDGPERRGDYE